MSEAPTDRITVAVADHVAAVTLNRPTKHNALDVAMFEAILATTQRLAGERGCGRSCCTAPVRASARAWTSPR